MVELKVKELAERIGIENATQLRAATGLGQGTSYGLWTGKSRRIDLDTIDVLCEVLQVQPGMLFERKPGR